MSNTNHNPRPAKSKKSTPSACNPILIYVLLLTLIPTLSTAKIFGSGGGIPIWMCFTVVVAPFCALEAVTTDHVKDDQNSPNPQLHETLSETFNPKKIYERHSSPKLLGDDTHAKIQVVPSATDIDNICIHNNDISQMDHLNQVKPSITFLQQPTNTSNAIPQYVSAIKQLSSSLVCVISDTTLSPVTPTSLFTQPNSLDDDIFGIPLSLGRWDVNSANMNYCNVTDHGDGTHRVTYSNGRVYNGVVNISKQQNGDWIITPNGHGTLSDINDEDIIGTWNMGIYNPDNPAVRDIGAMESDENGVIDAVIDMCCYTQIIEGMATERVISTASERCTVWLYNTKSKLFGVIHDIRYESGIITGDNIAKVIDYFDLEGNHIRTVHNVSVNPDGTIAPNNIADRIDYFDLEENHIRTVYDVSVDSGGFIIQGSIAYRVHYFGPTAPDLTNVRMNSDGTPIQSKRCDIF